MKQAFEDMKGMVGKVGRLLHEGRYRLLTAWAIYMVAIFLYQALFAWGIWERALAAAVTSTVLSTGLLRLHRDYVGGLRYRIRVGSNAPAWVVQMNDVEVGRLTDADYAQMRLDVANDPRVFFAQGVNWVRGVLNVLSSCLVSLPLLAFWVLLALALVWPSTLVEALARVRAFTPHELANAISFGATLLASSLMLTIVIFNLLEISTFGFSNCFSAAIARRVRQRLGITTEGKLVLTQWRFASPNREGDALFDQAPVLVRRNTVSR